MSTEAATVEITLNGKPAQVPRGQTVLGLVQSLGIQPDRVAVELNRAILKQAEWAVTALDPGAEVEVVHFVGGG